MSLEKYNLKRDFSKTPEPKGKVSTGHKNLFIIQKHAASHLHYDFRIELDGVLLSWAIPKGPCLDPTIKRLAMHVEDHPVEYGSFEGIIPKGEYGGGTVMLWDKGNWISRDENPHKAYHSGHLRFILNAEKLNGQFSLVKLKKDKDDNAWFLIKGKDEFAKDLADYDVTVAEPYSVLTQQSMEEIADNYENIWSQRGLVKPANKKKKKKFKINLGLDKSPMPKSILPQLATLVNKAPDGDEWLHELKFDGYRIIAFKQGEEIQLVSRNEKDWTEKFPSIVSELKKLSIKNIIVDGEIVVLDKTGKANFQLLQNAFKTTIKARFIYYIFDMLYVDEFDLRKLPLNERKDILSQFISGDTGLLRFSADIKGNGTEIFKNACDMGLEGIVSKLSTSPYEGRRSKTWLKIKCIKRQEFVIGGYLPPKGSRSYFGSLFLGYYENGILQFCGNVGTGFNEASLKDIYEKIVPLRTNKNPFNVRPPGVTKGIWVEPKLVAEIEFTEWTREGTLRHPSFKGLRTDKSPLSITKEKENRLETIEKKFPNPNAIKITNPKKILYPEDKISKIDLAHYYDQVSEFILPYIDSRPLTLVRCPENYKECFYQKHLANSMPKSLYGIPIKEKDEIENYIYLKDRAGLMGLVQMGVLEIHPWGSNIHYLDQPDTIVFDLDPAPDVKWKEVVETAKLVRDYLQQLNLLSFVKTTGGKGLHIVVPILPQLSWESVKAFTHGFVSALVKLNPRKYISEMSKVRRKGKIFIDYFRNSKGATSVAPYSTRSRVHAPVSTPLHWDELSHNQKDNMYTIHDLPIRLKTIKQDPWLNYFEIHQQLDPTLFKSE